MFLRALVSSLFSQTSSPVRYISTSNFVCREFRKNKRQFIVPKDDTLPQEKSVAVESAWLKKCEFPDENILDRLFSGVRFGDLPIVHIKVSKNNTLYLLSKPDGLAITSRSCGMDGFKNTRKGTNIAAQTTAIAFSKKISQLGFNQVRIAIRGLGPGRMASIKGLEMGGLDIVSITDTTPTCEGGCRARKQRRL